MRSVLKAAAAPLGRVIPNDIFERWRHAYLMARPLKSRRGMENTPANASASLDGLLEDHFAAHSFVTHPNRGSVSKALDLLGERPAAILETGSSAWGINSSRLFDQYVRRFGGTFLTVDIRSSPARHLQAVVSERTELLTGDSVEALRQLALRSPAPKFDLVYLDSFDLDIDAPLASMLHGLAEFMLLEPLTKPGSLILIDDTPLNEAEWSRVTGQTSRALERQTPIGTIVPGKGALVAKFLDPVQFEILGHDYQLLLRRKLR